MSSPEFSEPEYNWHAAEHDLSTYQTGQDIALTYARSGDRWPHISRQLASDFIMMVNTLCERSLDDERLKPARAKLCSTDPAFPIKLTARAAFFSDYDGNINYARASAEDILVVETSERPEGCSKADSYRSHTDLYVTKENTIYTRTIHYWKRFGLSHQSPSRISKPSPVKIEGLLSKLVSAAAITYLQPGMISLPEESLDILQD